MISLGLGPSAAVAGGERPAPPSLAGRADAGPTPPFADFFQHLLGRWAGDPDTGEDLEAAAAPDAPAKRA
ncbi:MAG: hypothetical protein OEW19_09485, partial [Acidobacteriota bacterium]|nr:hypothetical protein [Acidobacteriota bacterium]